MSNKKLRHVFLYSFGELVSKGVPFALLPYLTRKLGTEGFGELSYYLSIVAVIMIFISLSQEAATLSYYYKKGKNALPYLIVSGFLINLVMSFLLSYILYFYFKNIFVLVVLASFSVVYSFYLAVLQAQQKVKQYICVQIICALLIALFTFVFLEYNISDFVNKRLESLIVAYMLVSTPFLIFFVKNIRKINVRKTKLYSTYIVSYGIPLILHQLGIYVKGQLDRIFIYQQYSKSELGIYSAGVQVAALLPVMLLAINKAVIPYYYQSLRENSLTISVIKKYALYSLPLCVFPALVAWCIPEQFFLWFLGQDYANSKYYIVMYLLGFGLTLPYLLLVNYFFYHGKNLVISKITLTAALLYLVLLWFLSSKGIMLVPYALILSNILLILLLWTVLSKVEVNK
ncbi:TPA: oligosaccharide flippase family protein [Acinetobacter baumannii]|uniref:oligosaccharide flippase family protein n=1 Tax=Acinetobacter baumannii TaxID=470 RepID=UPI000D65289F|nr:oligosaccharide flippase family protein [Acinetobacter baumannii]HEE5839791.1 oligosaccharide flippase family protein [Acinetobacter baumannii]